ncbi:hypothetical protein [Thioclava kandeliae]|uniref:Uncharacterized protein n=1 Tax=Thioclava kandeliae TaxID=3070818 RepID=A0ABV1SFC3_9RHOB
MENVQSHFRNATPVTMTAAITAPVKITGDSERDLSAEYAEAMGEHPRLVSCDGIFDHADVFDDAGSSVSTRLIGLRIMDETGKTSYLCGNRMFRTFSREQILAIEDLQDAALAQDPSNGPHTFESFSED